MTKAHPELLLKQLNDSGFPLQIAVEQAVEAAPAPAFERPWAVAGVEVPWRHDGREGWTDLLLMREGVALAIDCKRVEANWIFASSSRQRADTRDLFVAEGLQSLEVGEGTTRTVYRGPLVQWRRVYTEPSSPEAAFCVARSKNDGAKRQLEPVASDLVAACESHGLVEAERAPTRTRWFIPVIVTTADLFLAEVDAKAIPLETGSADTSTFRPVSVVRFTKALGPLPAVAPAADSPIRYYRSLLRTVLVVRATSLLEVLATLDPFI